MDFVVTLPAFQNNTVIMVIVDRFSKARPFGMLPTHFTASKVAELFTTIICKLHGIREVLFFIGPPNFKEIVVRIPLIYIN